MTMGGKHARTTDWAAIRGSMKRAERAMQDALEPSPERARAIMDARAEALARVIASDSAEARINVIAFELNKERYAVETRFVREIIRFSDYTTLPGTPAYVVGVTNLRGTVLAVIDLRSFFNVAQKGVTDLSRVIVLGTTAVEFGILADEVHGQFNIAEADILAETGGQTRSGFLKGVMSDATLVLDGDTLITDRRFFIEQNN
jgi:purine-binding chemotaxis protein CheW